jgi:signal transduction histidine kinase/HD-like signal output (HDOD) protein
MIADAFDTRSLPVLPELADHVLRMALEDDVSVAKLSAIIEKDQSLTARILSMANSSHYKRSRAIYTVRDSIVIMGLEQVKTMALGMCVLEMFPSVPGSVLDYKEFWRHSLSCGLFSRAIMESADSRLSTKAFYAGLLHDIGKMILDQTDHERYAMVLEKAAEGIYSLFELEREMLGTTHCDVGRIALENWRLPSLYVESIWCHHAPVMVIDDDQYRLSGVVHVANILSHQNYIGTSGNSFPSRITNPLLKRFQLNADMLDDIMLTVPSEVETICNELGLGRPREGLFRLINKASMRLSDVSISLQQRTIKADKALRRSDILIDLITGLNRCAKISEALEVTAGVLRKSGFIKSFLGGIRASGMNLVFEMKPGEEPRFIRIGDEELKGIVISADYPIGMSLASGAFMYVKPVDEETGDDNRLISTVVEAMSAALKRIMSENVHSEQAEHLRNALSNVSVERQKAIDMLELNRELLDSSPFGLCLLDDTGAVSAENQISSEIRKALGISGPSIFEMLDKETTREVRTALISRHETDTIIRSGNRSIRIITHPLSVNSLSLLLTWDITKELEQQRRLAAYAKMSTIGNLAASMAHNMKSPLGAIQGFANIIKEDVKSGGVKILREGKVDQDFMAIVESIIAASESVLKIINQLLGLTRKWEGTTKKVDMKVFMGETIDMVKPLADASKVKLVTDIGAKHASIRASAVQQVVVNSLINAITASSLNQEVVLGVSKDAGRVVFRITDKGIGIDEEQISKIFEPLYSAWPSRTGMGLGLSLSRDIIETMGGDISVKSSPGAGSTFFISIPEEAS